MPTSETQTETQTQTKTTTNGTLVGAKLKIKKPDGTFELLDYAIDGNDLTPILAPKEYYLKFNRAGIVLSANVTGIKVIKISAGLYRVILPDSVPMNSVVLVQMTTFQDARTHFSWVDQESTTNFIVNCVQDLDIGSPDRNRYIDSEVYMWIKVPIVFT